MMNLICLVDPKLLWIYHQQTQQTLTENNPEQIYSNKIKNRVVFKVKTRYKLELLSPEKIKLLWSTKKDVHQDKYGEDVAKLESVKIVLMHYNLLNNNYQQASEVSFTLVPSKQFGL